MEFLRSISGKDEFDNPIGKQIELATQDLLLGADWEKNLEVCDMVSQSDEG